MQRSIVVIAVAFVAALVAACATAPAPETPSAPATATRTAGPPTVVGGVGSKVRVALPGLAPGAYAEIETRAVSDPAQGGDARRQIDSLCEIWAGEGALVGALNGRTISGDTARMTSANLVASVKATALDDSRVSYEVDAALDFEVASAPR
jgi:hypothetical protein